MSKEKLPIEKDVDIELEYKIYHLWDKVKKYLKFILAFVVILFIVSTGYYLYSKKKQEENEKASVYVSKIANLLSEDKKEEAKKLIEEFEKKYKDTNFYKVVLSYKVMIAKDEGKEDEKTANDLKEKLDTQLSEGVKEYIAYIKFKENENNQAKEILKSIDKDKYNYISAQSTLGLIYKKEGNYQEAEKIFNLIKENKDYRYFSILAKENL
ncbi:tetratricopeptide repeat protein [Sulfurihydrogenibium subterraneum]|uniref:tetratricopeptide repeat protein n=1 Tax=Sulfurihydrogenibium subterraneum TaxID=171121 RepID=UPI00048E8ACA|nr:tetratricopeptide repeat protein [Sulfurihydrogenibium subterraneum]